ncbi:MAG: Gfo/Idh/MocA family oxidoreductase [Verrucomicrobia bacterium]|nr:Gfo/Idh/MocA family oxidoreductase [Verrucomicrobiota bacterium]
MVGIAGGVLGFPSITRSQSPNSRLNIGCIGAGGRGGHNTQQMEGENIVALCDVNERNLSAARNRFPGARTYSDFRRMLEKRDDLDAVVISTTEHTHALATAYTLNIGCHVYCEKPLTHDVFEARYITEMARKAGVSTQMGTQIHAGDNYRRVVEHIQTGVIGAVTEVHVWVSRAWGGATLPDQTMDPPDYLDWDLWIGPAPYRPFHDIYFPGPKWYQWWDFGNGTMSDLGSHWIDLPFWALHLRAPVSIEAEGPPPNPETAPASMKAVYTYPNRGTLPGLTLTWYQGEYKPRQWTEKLIPPWESGVLFVGDDGMLLADYSKFVLLPESRFVDFQPPTPFIKPSIGHHQEWINACKSGARTTCNFDYAGPLTEANHLGNVAYRVGKKILWDPIKLEAIGCPEANAFLHRPYRSGWKLPI